MTRQTVKAPQRASRRRVLLVSPHEKQLADQSKAPPDIHGTAGAAPLSVVQLSLGGAGRRNGQAPRRGALRTEKLVLQDHDDDKHPEGSKQ
jgi:hypothetical protein